MLFRKRTQSLSVLALAGMLLLTARGAHATSFVWNGTLSFNWFTAGNWTPNGVPGAGDTVTLDNGGTIDLTAADATVAVFNLKDGKLQGEADLTVTSILRWTGGVMAGIGSTNVSSGAALNISGNFEKAIIYLTGQRP